MIHYSTDSLLFQKFSSTQLDFFSSNQVQSLTSSQMEALDEDQLQAVKRIMSTITGGLDNGGQIMISKYTDKQYIMNVFEGWLEIRKS